MASQARPLELGPPYSLGSRGEGCLPPLHSRRVSGVSPDLLSEVRHLSWDSLSLGEQEMLRSSLKVSSSISMPTHAGGPVHSQICLLRQKHRCLSMNICIISSLWKAHGLQVRAHTCSIYSSHPSSGTLVSKLGVFPAAKLNCSSTSLLDPPEPRNSPQSPQSPSLLSIPRGSLCPFPLCPALRKTKAVGTACNSLYRNFISKNSRLGACLHPTPTAIVVNFPLASPLLQNAIGRGGL